MVKIQLAVPRIHEAPFLQWLQDREVVQLVTLSDVGTAATGGTNEDLSLANIQFALEFIARIKGELAITEKRSLQNMFAARPVETLDDLEAGLEKLDLEELFQKIRVTRDALNDIDTEQREVADMLQQLMPWQTLAVSGDSLHGSEVVRHALITVNLPEETLVTEKLQAVPTLAFQEVYREIEKKRGTIYLQVVVHRREEELFNEILTQTNATLMTLPIPQDHTLAEEIASLTAREKELMNNYDQAIEAARGILPLEHDFRLAYDALLHRKERAAASAQGEHMSLSVVFEGWMPEDATGPLKQEMEKKFPTAAVLEVEAAEEEVPPVALKNGKLVEPFEAVTGIYGNPKYTELDPTGPLSLFFLIAFGLALTDAGYGIIMMITMWAAQRFFRLKRDMKKMVRLLFYAGFSTVIFGALTGGWFGIVLEELPENVVSDFLLSMKVLDPVSSPMILLGIVFAFGVVQLLFAWLVRAYDHYRQGDYYAMLADDLAWFSMVVLLLLWIASGQGIFMASGRGVLTALLWVNAAFLALTQGRSYANPAVRLGAGAVSLYGLISFISDMLSYSRLLALGLATGIIALVVNMIGRLAMDSLPYIGWLVAIGVLIGGHIFNLGINALGAFIHSGRLQYVEFFPKFLEGGGEPFRPLKRNGKYVDNPNDFV